MLRPLLALALVAMLFGCVAQPYSTGQQGAGPQPQVPAAPANASQQPVGQAPQQNANGSQQNQNTTAPLPHQNVTAPPAPLQPGPQQTNLSAAGLLDQKLDALPHKRGGPWVETKYTWVSQDSGNEPGAIVISNPTYSVLFDGNAEGRMAAFGFKTYKPAAGPATASGFVLVYDGSLMLDNRAASGLAMGISYTTPQNVEMALNGTAIVSKDVVLDAYNRTLAVYGFEAEEAG